MVISDGGVGITVEWDEGIDEIPYCLVIRMEDVGTIFMDMDALNILAVYISAKISSFVYDKASFPIFSCEVGKCRSADSRTDN